MFTIAGVTDGFASTTSDNHTATADHSASTAAFGRQISAHHSVAKFVAVDVALLAGLGISLIAARHGVGAVVSPDRLSSELSIVVIGCVLFLASGRLLGTYRTRLLVTGNRVTKRLLATLFVTFSLMIIIAAAAKVTDAYSRLWFFSWMAASVISLPILRQILLRRLRHALEKGAYIYRGLSVGVMCEPLCQAEIARHSLGLTKALTPVALQNLQQISLLANEIRKQEIDEIFIAVPWSIAPDVFDRTRALKYLSANVYVVPHVDNKALSFLSARTRDGGLQIQVLDRPIEGWGLWFKRSFDVIASAIALILVSPLMVATALAIKLESRGPVFFRQPRHGFNGGTFELLKFRSMYVDRCDVAAGEQTSRGDPRVTRVGRFIRRQSIDELPQIINVLKGDMSLVGPRPHGLKTSTEGQLLADAVADYAARHRVLPGITGWAQVNGLRGELDSIEKLRKRVQYDMEYIDKWSMNFDVRILLKTLRLLGFDRNAY